MSRISLKRTVNSFGNSFGNGKRKKHHNLITREEEEKKEKEERACYCIHTLAWDDFDLIPAPSNFWAEPFLTTLSLTQPRFYWRILCGFCLSFVLSNLTN